MSPSVGALTGCLSVYGWSHHTAPLELREGFTLSAIQRVELRDWLAMHESIRESAVLATCNRFEVYTVSAHGAENERGAEAREALAGKLIQLTGCSSAALQTVARFHQDQQAINHLFRVAAGLDSQMVGETEILGQVKRAYQEAVAGGTIGPVLHRAFQKSLQQGKWARSKTAIGRGNVSVSTVATELAVRIFGDLSAVSLLMLGTGEVAEQSLKVFLSEGCADVRFCGRNRDRLETLARLAAGDAGASAASVPVYAMEQLEQALEGVDVVLCSTASDEPLITPALIDKLDPARRGRPLFFIDVAVPRDVDPQCGQRDNIFLYNLDDLAAVANENLEQRRREVEACEHHLSEAARETAKQLGWRS